MLHRIEEACGEGEKGRIKTVWTGTGSRGSLPSRRRNDLVFGVISWWDCRGIDVVIAPRVVLAASGDTGSW